MATIAFAGNYAGTIVSMPVSGILANTFGWESLFYVFGMPSIQFYFVRFFFLHLFYLQNNFVGTIGCIWYICWVIIVRRGPSDDKYISKDELRYIQDCLGATEKSNAATVKHPWKDIFTSKAVYAICASHFAENWGFYTMLTQLPSFLAGLFVCLFVFWVFSSSIFGLFSFIFISISIYRHTRL